MSEEENSVEDIEAKYKALMSERNKQLEIEIAAKRADEEAKAKEKADEELAAQVEAKALEKFEEFKAKADAEREKKANEIAASGAGIGTLINQGDESKAQVDSLQAKVLKRASNWLSGRGIDIKDIKPYSADDLNAMGANPNFNSFAFTDIDSGCEDNIAAWSPADVWCNSIWYAAQCKQMLAGKVTVRACDINKGDGLSVQIRAISADTFPSALGACECASCVSNTFTTYTLTLHRYDLYKVMCNLDEFDVGEVLPTAMAQAMVNSFAAGLDGLVYTALSGATPGYTETSTVSFSCDPSRGTYGECCAYGANFYKELIELEAQMRAAGYFNDADPVLIVHPRVALYLKYKEGINPPPWVNNITMDGNKISKIGDINVIEYCGANSCTDSSGPGAWKVMGVLIDPSRAVGEAYGKRPQLKVDEDPIECDSMKFVYRMYVAIQALDTGAIGHILNP